MPYFDEQLKILSQWTVCFGIDTQYFIEDVYLLKALMDIIQTYQRQAKI